MPWRKKNFFNLAIACVFFFSKFYVGKAQLPAVCTNSWNFYQQICCPEPFIGAGPCGSNLALPRGQCISVTTDQSTTDIRGNWPHYYSKICECGSQFGNFDCGECASGFKGENCDEKVVRTRKFLNHLTSDELNDYISTMFMAKTFPSRYVAVVKETKPGVVPEMKVASVYHIFVWVHYYISKESYVYDFGHGGPGFPIWHRKYLMYFERELQWMLGNGSNFAFPFWDWSSPDHRMYPFQEHILGASDASGNLVGNLANWTVVCGDSITTGILCDPSIVKDHMTRFRTQKVYSANYTKWPRRQEICKAMEIPIYDTSPYNPLVEAPKSFRNFMEGFYVGDEECNSVLFECTSERTRLQLHNQVHNMMNGTITDVPIASNDPLFMLHHSFVDYILEVWIRRYHGDFKPSADDTTAAKGHNYNDVIVPFLPLVTAHEMLVESTTLGWTYESLDGLDLENKACELWLTKNSSDTNILYPKTAKSESYATKIPEFLPGRKSDEQVIKLTARVKEVPGTANKFFSIMSKPRNSNSREMIFKVSNDLSEPNHYACVLTSKELFFQIPKRCDELVFPSNLLLPENLTPLMWYGCSPHTPSGFDVKQVGSSLTRKPHILYDCMKL